MPIYRMFEHEAFEPEHCKAMAAAFEAMLQQYGLQDRTDPMCDKIARKIIELGQQGIHDSGKLVDLTKEAFRRD